MAVTPSTALFLISGLLTGTIGFAWAAEEFPYRPPDGELQRTIAHRLNNHDALGERHIEVEVKQGRVTLRGTVGSAFEKTHAFFLATVPGVAEIDNRIEIEGEDRPDDETLRSNITQAFLRDSRVASAGVRIQVKDGIVTLRGTVNSQESKQAAAYIARQFAGAKRVHNYVEVRRGEEGDFSG